LPENRKANDIETYVTKLGFKKATEVQQSCFEDILAGKDVFAQAPTGSGKTIAYLAPLFEKYKNVKRTNTVLILTPTHELALQVARTANQLSAAMKINLRSAVIVGDATRIHELIKKRKIAGHLIKTVVLDEGDKLYEDSNVYMTDEVVKCFMRDRQFLMFSATLTDESVEHAKKWTENALIKKSAGGREIPANIKHWYLVCEKRDKLAVLRGVTGAIRTKKAMIFINGANESLEALSKLHAKSYKVDLIGGSRTKEERRKAMHDYSHGKVKYLIATDLAARGLQFDNVDTVFHISMPEDSHDYLHRAGRTGRAGKVGRNLSIVTKGELSLIRKYEKDLNIKFSEKYYYDGKLMDVPKGK